MHPPHFNHAPMRKPLLTVIVPVYNERPTIERLLQRLLDGPYPDKEIIVVDDGSEDGTAAVLERWADHPNILVLHHARNRGKGAAVRTGLAQAHGVLTLIQDADLEYDPNDWPRLIEPLCCGKASVVYGSRYLRPSNCLPWSKFRLAVCLLNLLVRLLYGRRLSDEATCYKVMPTALLRDLDLQANRFELCAEITAKICRLGWPILEVPISYQPRTTREGKKIGWRDAWSTIRAFLQWRFRPLPRIVHDSIARRRIIAPADFFTHFAAAPAVRPRARRGDARRRSAPTACDTAPHASP